MTTTLITGGNRSLGLETARRLIQAGHTVYAGMRDPESGDAARALGARVLRVDVTDQRSVEAAFRRAARAGRPRQQRGHPRHRVRRRRS